MPIKIEFKEVKFEDLKVGDYVEVFSGERHSDYCVGFITEFIEEPDGTHYIAIGDNLHHVEPRDSYKRATPVIDEKELEEKIEYAWAPNADRRVENEEFMSEFSFTATVKNLIKALMGG